LQSQPDDVPVTMATYCSRTFEFIDPPFLVFSHEVSRGARYADEEAAHRRRPECKCEFHRTDMVDERPQHSALGIGQNAFDLEASDITPALLDHHFQHA
jgi:hypothetical protein